MQSSQPLHVSTLILPGPLNVVWAILHLLSRASTWGHLWVTARDTLLGFLLALVVGVSIGLMVGKYSWVEWTLRPFVIFTQVLPKVALVPLFLVWFGFGSPSKIITAAVMGFFPIFTNTVLGIKSIDLGFREVMTGIEASAWQNFAWLEIPAAAPHIFAAMEMAAILALIGSVVGQYLAGNEGLGYLLITKMNAYETDSLFACIFLLASLGLTLHALVTSLRHLLLPWQTARH